MRDLLISSSVLILSILLIRHLVKEKISPLLQYMLWLPIVLRLMLPFPLWDSSVSVMNLFPEKGVIEYLQEVNEENRSQMLQQDNQAEDLELDIQQANGYVAETNEQVFAINLVSRCGCGRRLYAFLSDKMEKVFTEKQKEVNNRKSLF